MGPVGGEERTQRGYRITGRVQGVGFRWWTRRVAVGLGVRGAVRNRSDGAVEVHASAAPEVLDRFEAYLHEGPRGARVDSVDPMESGLPLPADDFIIRG